MLQLKHVVSDTGFHYIKDEETGRQGEEVGYQGIAHFVHLRSGRRFIAVTGYHAHRQMQTGIVYEIRSSVSDI